MIYKILALILVPTFAFAASTANDPNRQNLVVSEAYRDQTGGTIIRFEKRTARNPKVRSQNVSFNNPDWIQSDLTFYCKEGRCDQLNDLGLTATADGATSTVRFETGAGARGALVVSRAKGHYELNCDGEKKSLRALSGSEIASITTSIREGELRAFSLPELRTREFAFKVGDKYIYVDSQKYGRHTAGEHRFYFGTPGAMEQKKILRYTVNRDGGTTEIHLGGGEMMFIPTRKKQLAGALPSYNGVNLATLRDSELQAITPRAQDLVRDDSGEARVAPCVKADAPSSARTGAADAGEASSVNRSR